MKRKTWMALAVLTLMAGMFTGCGSVPEESSGESRTIETEEPEGNGGDETVTLRIVSKELNPQDETQMAWLEEYNRALAEAGINAQLELVNIQSGSYADNLALMLNGGDIPDLIYFQLLQRPLAHSGILIFSRFILYPGLRQAKRLIKYAVHAVQRAVHPKYCLMILLQFLQHRSIIVNSGIFQKSPRRLQGIKHIPPDHRNLNGSRFHINKIGIV